MTCIFIFFFRYERSGPWPPGITPKALMSKASLTMQFRKWIHVKTEMCGHWLTWFGAFEGGRKNKFFSFPSPILTQLREYIFFWMSLLSRFQNATGNTELLCSSHLCIHKVLCDLMRSCEELPFYLIQRISSFCSVSLEFYSTWYLTPVLIPSTSRIQKLTSGKKLILPYS